MGRKKRIAIWVVLLAVILGGVAAVCLLWPGSRSKIEAERVVRGRPASYWIDRLTDRLPLNDMVMQWDSFGTNAVPMLVSALERGTSWRERNYQRIWPRLPSRLKQMLPPPNSYPAVRQSAMYVLGQMGAEARPAIPLLVETAKSDPDRMMRFSAVECLGRIKAASQGPSQTNNTVLVQALAAAIKDPDMMVRLNAAASLGGGGEEPAIAVPALVIGLQDTNAMVRQRAAASLSFYGKSAAPAVPALLKALAEDKEVNVRVNARNSLGQIDPEALARAIGPGK